MTPPPGWYPEPHTPTGERWWDGNAWTEQRRASGSTEPAGGAAPQAPDGAQQPGGAGQFGPPSGDSGQFGPPSPPDGPGGFGPPSPPGGQGSFGPPTPVPPGRPPGGGRNKVIALVVAAVVLVAAAITGVVVFGGDDDPEAGPDPSPTATKDDKPDPVDSPTVSASPSASDDPSTAVDPLNGLVFKLPKGWEKPDSLSDDTLKMAYGDTYDCPGKGLLCRHGKVHSTTVSSTDEKSPKALASKDISENAKLAYDEDELGDQPYGGMKSHLKVDEGAIAVAGRSGYYVRWKVVTEVGPGGYVQSIAFPSSVGSESLVMLRLVFDEGKDGPPLSDMDKIVKDLRSTADNGSGGAGSDVSPTGT
ncbi:DUF2510 domain-containing protein [Streptomyces sp. NPDC058045]|uniref:DUF2510 domain-containing protein n=1 Tax=Streptomyces sp. NPDC058045 TaxID=3346311 RepID=UPI0036E87C78